MTNYRHISKVLQSLALLGALTSLSASCAKRSQLTPSTVIPQIPCVLPPVPTPMASLTSVSDCDGPGINTDVCMSEEDLYTIMVYVIQLATWADLANACPGVQNTGTKIPAPELSFHDPRKEA